MAQACAPPLAKNDLAQQGAISTDRMSQESALHGNLQTSASTYMDNQAVPAQCENPWKKMLDGQAQQREEARQQQELRPDNRSSLPPMVNSRESAADQGAATSDSVSMQLLVPADY